jgi:hypothetical protein
LAETFHERALRRIALNTITIGVEDVRRGLTGQDPVGREPMEVVPLGCQKGSSGAQAVAGQASTISFQAGTMVIARRD